MEQDLEMLDKPRKVVFRFDDDKVEKLKIIAAKKRMTQNDCFNDAMDDYFKKNEKLLK